ncbi:TPA: hypothetical protein ACPJ0T_004338 [Vibrio alginolyticus]|uniref:hypothetical protein n=1 Tax=Vibrio alginolyticus TaxID=663 RepID=UPI00215C4736|nr:hypothetical protein [Vibrio alginolyticus]MCR9559171.1 hypothetical protein [Vibrio alginolyticus]
MKKAFSVEDCIQKLPNLVNGWPIAMTVLNVRSQGWPEDETQALTKHDGVKKQVIHFLPDSEDEASLMTLEQVKGRVVDVAVSANVLNQMTNLEEGLAELAHVPFETLVIQIHEGNRSGKASGTKKRNTYQKNQPIEAYVRPVHQHFHRYDITLHRADNCIVVTKGRKYYQLDDTEV